MLNHRRLQRFNDRRPFRQAGRWLLLIRSLIVGSGLALGADRGPAAENVLVPGPSVSAPLAGGQAATNGTLIIPVRDASGQLRQTMVLVPVQARTVRPNREPILEPQRPAATVAKSGSANSPTNAAATAAAGQRVLEAQVALVRRGLSPGSLDGLMGTQTRAAIQAFQIRENLPMTGQLDDYTLQHLRLDDPPYTNYVVAPLDLERLLPLSGTWLGKSQQPRLDYETLLELVAERTFTHPNLLRRLNPLIEWTNVIAGSELTVLAVGYPNPEEKAAFLRIRLGERSLKAFGAATNVLAHFPCSIAQRVEKRPVGERLEIVTVAPNPNYTFDPAVFPESAEARELGRKLVLQPGPNNPVGTVWIGLDKPGYGIHGTPRPEDVGRTESHGCFRLANWNAEHLLKLIDIGIPVYVEP